MRRPPGVHRVLHGLVVVIGLFATVATSRPRWSVDAPEVGAAARFLDASAPTGEQRFRVVAAPALVDHEHAWAQVDVRGTVTWHDAGEATSSVLRVTYNSLVGADAKPVADVVLRPGEPTTFAASGHFDLSTCAPGKPCTDVVGASYVWEQPQGRIEVAWSASAGAAGPQSRRDSGPKGEHLLVVEVMP
jgi:hypothetical protein